MNEVRERGLVFPTDLFGRFACVIVGAFFSVLGIGSLAVLISNRRGFNALAIYDMSVAVALSGISLLLWGIFTPGWLSRIAHHAISHFLVVVGALFLPFAIEAIFILLSGKV